MRAKQLTARDLCTECDADTMSMSDAVVASGIDKQLLAYLCAHGIIPCVTREVPDASNGLLVEIRPYTHALMLLKSAFSGATLGRTVYRNSARAEGCFLSEITPYPTTD